MAKKTIHFLDNPSTFDILKYGLVSDLECQEFACVNAFAMSSTQLHTRLAMSSYSYLVQQSIF